MTWHKPCISAWQCSHLWGFFMPLLTHYWTYQCLFKELPHPGGHTVIWLTKSVFLQHFFRAGCMITWIREWQKKTTISEKRHWFRSNPLPVIVLWVSCGLSSAGSGVTRLWGYSEHLMWFFTKLCSLIKPSHSTQLCLTRFAYFWWCCLELHKAKEQLCHSSSSLLSPRS